MSFLLPMSLCLVAVVASSGQTPATVPDQTPHPDRFVGTWKYSEVDSVDASTGKPERTSIEQHAGQAPTSGPATAPPDGGGVTSCIGCAGTSSGDPRIGATILGVNQVANGIGNGSQPVTGPTSDERRREEAHDLVRDLTEIAETLTITMSKTSMSMTDDLGRAWTYPIDGKKRKYRISASSYDAAAHWNGAGLELDITGDQGFQMTDTFLVAEDSSRLFLILRIGKPPAGDSGPTATGANGRVGTSGSTAPHVGSGAIPRAGVAPPSSGSPAPASSTAPVHLPGANRVYARLKPGGSSS